MAKYKVDGVQYEIDDSLDLNQTVAQIRASADHAAAMEELRAPSVGKFLAGAPDDRTQEQVNQDFESMSIPRQAGEAAVGMGEAAVSMGTALGGLAAQGGVYLRGLAGGEDPNSPAMKQAGQEAAEEWTYQPRTTGGKAVLGKVGEWWEEAKDVMGMAGGHAPAAQQAMGIDFDQPLDQPKAPLPFSEEGRAAAEFGLEGGAFTQPLRSARRSAQAQRAQNAELSKSQEILEKSFEAEAKLKAESEAAQAYQKGYEQLDNTMMRYPKDYQAPQYGMGGKLARVPDQVKAERPKIDQEKFDAEMYEIARNEAQRIAEETAVRRSMEMRPMPEPMAERKPHLVGPKAESRPVVDVDAIATEVAAKMNRPRAVQEAAQQTRQVFGDDSNSLSTARNKTLGFNQKLHELQTGIRWNKDRGYFEEIPTSFRSQLEAIRDGSEIPYYRELAARLLEDKSFNPKFSVLSEVELKALTGQKSAMAYNPNIHEISASIRHLGNEMYTLHEAIHAATYGMIESLRGTRFRTDGHYARAINADAKLGRLQDLYNGFLVYYRERSPEPVLPYGLKDIHEFIAEGFTNPDFQALLARTPLPKNLRRGGATMWDRFVSTIADLLGLKGKENYLSELIRVGAGIIKDSGPAWRTRLSTVKESSLGALEYKDFRQQLKDAGVQIPDEAAKALFDAKTKARPDPKAHPTEKATAGGAESLQRQYADRRSLEEVAKDLENVKEDTLADQASYNTVGKILQGRFIAKGNPLLSWASSKIHWTKQESIQKANNKLHGSSRKNPDPGTYNYLWKGFKKDSKIAVNEVGQALQGEKAWLGDAGIQAKAREVVGRELTAVELQAYKDRIRINKEVLSDFNAAMIAEGKEPIAELPHYWSPAVFDGPFKVKFLNKAGETVKVEGFYMKPNMEKMRRQFSEYKLEEVPDSGLRGDVDWQQFEWVLRQVSKEMRDPAAQAISEGLRRMGFKKHGLKRKGVKGAKGTEGGIQGVRNYEEVSERYIRQAYDFLANRELDKVYNQLNDLKEANHLPYTKTWALEAVDAARGGSNKAFDALSRELSAAVSGTIAVGTAGKVRLPQRFTRDLLRYGNKVKTTLLLGFFNPIHIGAQLLQAPTFMPPKLLAMAAEAGINPLRIMNVLGRSLKEYSKWDNSKDAANLAKIGAFDATFKYDWSTYAGDSAPHYKRTVTEHATGLSTLMWVESHAVRRPAAHMFLEMLREMGYEKIAKDKMEIYKVAREMTDHYMVSMRFYEKPHVFSRTGLAGMAFGPLKSFATTWLGMLREYAKLSGSGLLEGSVAKSVPLAGFMSASVLTAGMLGVVGIKEWDVLAELANEYFGTNIPTGTEWVMSNFKSPGIRYGMLSEALPFNMSVGPTFANPSLADQNFWSAPGVGLLRDMVKGVGTLAMNAGIAGEENIPGPTEKREAAKALFPRFSPVPGYNWADVERHFTPEGQPYAERSGAAGPYTRTEEDWTARRLGTYTTQERDEKAKFYTAKKRVKSMTKHIDRAVDLILSGQNLDRLPTLWSALAEKGFTSKEISTALYREVYNRLVESDVRAVGRAMTPRQQRLWLLYQQLQGQQ